MQQMIQGAMAGDPMARQFLSDIVKVQMPRNAAAPDYAISLRQTLQDTLGSFDPRAYIAPPPPPQEAPQGGAEGQLPPELLQMLMGDTQAAMGPQGAPPAPGGGQPPQAGPEGLLGLLGG